MNEIKLTEIRFVNNFITLFRLYIFTSLVLYLKFKCQISKYDLRKFSSYLKENTPLLRYKDRSVD